VSKFNSISVQPLWPLHRKFVRSCFSNRVFRLRQRRSLISAQGWALATLGSELVSSGHDSERVACSLAGNRRKSFRVVAEEERLLSQGFEANPGLKLANAAGVKACRASAIKSYREEP
jgi:hypothetical protein